MTKKHRAKVQWLHSNLGPLTIGMMCGGDSAEVFESLGRHGEAITAAQADIRNYPLFCLVTTQSRAAIGRCHAELGRPAEAAAAFEAAIEVAHRCELPFVEMCAHRDYIVHVLDAGGRRESQMTALGGAISRMVLAPSEYTAILGSGIDAEAAVAAFNAAPQPPRSAPLALLQRPWRLE